jgi:hypothetical protein
LLANITSRQPIVAPHGGRHVLVPFAIEDGGMLGAHAHALLRALAKVALAKGRTPSLPSRVADAPHHMLISMWARRLQHRL